MSRCLEPLKNLQKGDFWGSFTPILTRHDWMSREWWQQLPVSQDVGAGDNGVDENAVLESIVKNAGAQRKTTQKTKYPSCHSHG